MDPAKLTYVVEGSFPTPIARAFAEMRRHETDTLDTQHPAAVLEATLQFLGVVALADALSLPAEVETPETLALQSFVNDSAGLRGFRRPVTAGSWGQVLHHGLRASTSAGREEGPMSLAIWHAQEGRALIETAVATRNQVHRGQADYHSLKKSINRLLVSVADNLSGHYLVCVEGMSLRDGVRQASAKLFEGVDATRSVIELSDEVETGRVYLVTPRERVLLCLDPFYRLLDCGECRTTHLMSLELVNESRGEFRGVGVTHRLPVKGVEGDVRRLLGRHAPSSRRVLERVALPWSTPPVAKGRLSSGECVADRYEIEAWLGEGGMGQVYRARDRRTAEQVAIKLLPWFLLRDRTLVERFRMEADSARRLEHPGIARVLDYGEVSGDHYLVMELASGWPSPPSASRALDLSWLKKPVDSETVTQIARQLLEALGYLHSRGVVHRDVKPQNVLLFEGNRVKLADFGIARSRESLTLTMTGQLLGTPEYISPEQADGMRGLDGRSDLYSLGVVLFELLTGRVPFKAATALATALKQKTDPPPPLGDEIPAILRYVVRRALEKEPEARFRTAAEFDEVLATGNVPPTAVHEVAAIPRMPPGPKTPSTETGRQATLVKGSLASQLLRWIALPLGVGVIALTQAVAITVAETYGERIGLFGMAVLSAVSYYSAYLPCRLAPDRKVAATVVLTLFVLGGAFSLRSLWDQMSWTVLLIRLWTDAMVIAGAFVAARRDPTTA